MQHDVLIAGAGPTGLVLALWLTKQGVRVRIIDKAAAPGTTSRALAVQARTLELYRQLDLAEAAIAHGKVTRAINVWIEGKQRARLAFDNVGRELTPYSFLLIYPQDRHERLLIAKLEELGVSVERNTELLSFDDRGDRVVARLRTIDGVESTCEAAYVAGCDGARSKVREQLGAQFPGGTYDKIFYVADAEISGPSVNGEAHMSLIEDDFVLILSYEAPGQVRLVGTVTAEHGGDSATLTFDDVGHRALAGLGLTVEKVNWFSTYHVHHRVSDRFRVGRAFLVGDAAHIHSPAGGQGMNTGIGDAINLAWKLAAVIQGRAPETLLDSYESERRPFAERLVQTTDRLFTFVTAGGDFASFVRNRIAPILVPLLSRPDAVREYLFRVVSQTMIAYRDSPTSEGKAGSVHGGDRLPWVRSHDADNYESTRRICWQAHVYGRAPEDVVSWCAAHHVPLEIFEWSDDHERAGFTRDALYLLRPDSYVALALPSPSAERLQTYGQSRGLTFDDGVTAR